MLFPIQQQTSAVINLSTTYAQGVVVSDTTVILRSDNVALSLRQREGRAVVQVLVLMAGVMLWQKALRKLFSDVKKNTWQLVLEICIVTFVFISSRSQSGLKARFWRMTVICWGKMQLQYLPTAATLIEVSMYSRVQFMDQSNTIQYLSAKTSPSPSYTFTSTVQSTKILVTPTTMIPLWMFCRNKFPYSMRLYWQALASLQKLVWLAYPAKSAGFVAAPILIEHDAGMFVFKFNLTFVFQMNLVVLARREDEMLVMRSRRCQEGWCQREIEVGQTRVVDETLMQLTFSIFYAHRKQLKLPGVRFFTKLQQHLLPTAHFIPLTPSMLIQIGPLLMLPHSISTSQVQSPFSIIPKSIEIPVVPFDSKGTEAAAFDKLQVEGWEVLSSSHTLVGLEEMGLVRMAL